MRRALLLLACAACGPSVPSAQGTCDVPALVAAAGEVETAAKAWDPSSGATPTTSTIAAEGIWRACHGLPVGLRAYLDLSVVHPRDPATLRGEPLPAVRVDPVEAILPGHAAVHNTPIWTDPAVDGRLLAICPDKQAIMQRVDASPAAERARIVYEGCGFAGVGLVELAELSPDLVDLAGRFGHVLFRYLVEAGAPTEAARTLARAVVFSPAGAQFGAESPSLLPASASGQPPSGLHPTVIVDLAGVTFDSKNIVPLRDGALPEELVTSGIVGPVFDALAEELDKERALRASGSARERPPADEDLPLVVVADPRVRWSTLGPLCLTARRAGHTALEASVLAPDPSRPLARVRLATFADNPAFDVEVGPTTLRLRCEGKTTDVAASALAGAAAGCRGDRVRLVVAEDTTWQRLVDIAGALGDSKQIAELSPAL